MADPLALQVHEILNRAMEVEKEGKAGLSQQACREYPELAAKVEQLVAAVRGLADFPGGAGCSASPRWRIMGYRL